MVMFIFVRVVKDGRQMNLYFCGFQKYYYLYLKEEINNYYLVLDSAPSYRKILDEDKKEVPNEILIISLIYYNE